MTLVERLKELILEKQAVVAVLTREMLVEKYDTWKSRSMTETMKSYEQGIVVGLQLAEISALAHSVAIKNGLVKDIELLLNLAVPEEKCRELDESDEYREIQLEQEAAKAGIFEDIDFDSNRGDSNGRH